MTALYCKRFEVASIDPNNGVIVTMLLLAFFPRAYFRDNPNEDG